MFKKRTLRPARLYCLFSMGADNRDCASITYTVTIPSLFNVGQGLSRWLLAEKQGLLDDFNSPLI